VQEVAEPVAVSALLSGLMVGIGHIVWVNRGEVVKATYCGSPLVDWNEDW